MIGFLSTASFLLDDPVHPSDELSWTCSLSVGANISHLPFDPRWGRERPGSAQVDHSPVLNWVKTLPLLPLSPRLGIGFFSFFFLLPSLLMIPRQPRLHLSCKPPAHLNDIYWPMPLTHRDIIGRILPQSLDGSSLSLAIFVEEQGSSAGGAQTGGGSAAVWPAAASLLPRKGNSLTDGSSSHVSSTVVRTGKKRAEV